MKSLTRFISSCILVFTAGANGQSTASISESSLHNSVFGVVAKEQGVDAALLYSISFFLTSRKMDNGNIAPHAFAITVNGKMQYPESEIEAWEILRDHLDDTENVSIGLMQVNNLYDPQPYPRLMLNPKHNLTFGAIKLKKLIDTTDDPILAVGKYFYPNDKIIAMKYGSKIWQIRANLLRKDAIAVTPKIRIDEVSYVQTRQRPNLE